MRGRFSNNASSEAIEKRRKTKLGRKKGKVLFRCTSNKQIAAQSK
jgi:hypothetical protein